MRKKIWVVTVLCIIFMALFIALHSAQAATTQTYPTRPLEIICPYTAGSPTDILARLIANIGPKYFGQPVVVVNKPGAASTLAAADVISSKPDGYKVFLGSQAFFATTLRSQKVPFQKDDLVPLANFAEYRMGLMVKGDSPFKTFDDLANYGKKNPGQLKWAHVGRGVTHHMSGLLVFRRAGIQTIDVPYKGGPEAVAALIGGHVDAASLTWGAVLENVRAGRIRVLMFYADKRYKDQPEIPSALELGFGDAVIPGLFGLYVHKDTPDSVKKTLMDLCRKIYDDPEFKKGMDNIGEEPRFGGPEFVKEQIKKMEDVGIPILKDLGMYVGK
jgi:tripartite-type tricarboxylate transporter receptor subunit TctC